MVGKHASLLIYTKKFHKIKRSRLQIQRHKQNELVERLLDIHTHRGELDSRSELNMGHSCTHSNFRAYISHILEIL